MHLQLQATGFLWTFKKKKKIQILRGSGVISPLNLKPTKQLSPRGFKAILVHVNSSEWGIATSSLSVKVHDLSHSSCRKLGQLWGWVREAIVKKWGGGVRGGLNRLTGSRVLLTGLNLKEKSPSYDERSTEYVSANWLSFFFYLVLADASNPLLWKPNDLRPASSPLPPHLLYLLLVQEQWFLRKLCHLLWSSFFFQNQCWWQISKGQTIKLTLWSFAFFHILSLCTTLPSLWVTKSQKIH